MGLPFFDFFLQVELPHGKYYTNPIIHPIWVLEAVDSHHPDNLLNLPMEANVPEWASGSEKNTLVFTMLRVTGSRPQFRKPTNFRKGRLQMFRPTRSSELSRCWVMVSWGVLVQKNYVSRVTSEVTESFLMCIWCPPCLSFVRFVPCCRWLCIRSFVPCHWHACYFVSSGLKNTGWAPRVQGWIGHCPRLEPG